ncbi:MAG TPA: hypothetical protein VMW23_03180 [Sedimentisphaerales bacterium]|nr:hypothetical protein [Sedimentisphaerales bacterium]
MNRKQKIVLWIGIGLFVVMGLFPPWATKLSNNRQVNSGYAFICTPPPIIELNTTGKIFGPFKSCGAHIDISRLCLQWAMVSVVAGGLIITFKDKKDD